MSHRAIFWADPGISTGMAWGVFDDRASTVVNALRSRSHSGSVTFSTSGRWGIDEMREHAMAIKTYWEVFTDEILPMADKDPMTIEFGMEHFILVPGMHKPGVEGIFPAFVIGAVAVELPEEDIILQSASVGMKWNTRDYHTKYGTWVVGKQHERAAFAHIAARMHQVLR